MGSGGQKNKQRKVKQLESQYKQIFGQETAVSFNSKTKEQLPPIYELLILLNEKKYKHRKLFQTAFEHKVEVSDPKGLRHTLNKKLKLPIELVRRFFDRQLALIHSALQVYWIAECLKSKKEMNQVED